MMAIFQGAFSFNQNIGNWDTSNVEYMSGVFYKASAFNKDISGWCVSKVRNKTNFNYNANAWLLPKPNWGTCPNQ